MIYFIKMITFVILEHFGWDEYFGIQKKTVAKMKKNLKKLFKFTSLWDFFVRFNKMLRLTRRFKFFFTSR